MIDFGLLGLLLNMVMGVCRIFWFILGKLRLLPAFIFLVITEVWFYEWKQSIGWWWDAIVYALAALGLGSFVVQFILKTKAEINKNTEEQL